MSDYNFNTGDASQNEIVQNQNDHVNEDVQRQTQSESNSQTLIPQIPNDDAPFVVLCGPPSSGKSMVLKCLATYLYSNSDYPDYTIAANKTLLKTPKYQRDCDEFDSIIGSPNIPMKNTVDYLLADILESGTVKAHFLEAPGEDFFSLDDKIETPNRAFKGYLDAITTTNGNKQRKVIYIILLDLDSPVSFRNDPGIRQRYEAKMRRLYENYVSNKRGRRVILLYNKIDIPHNGALGNVNGPKNLKEILKDAKRNYPRLFFTKKFLFWNFDNYTFLPFCTGSYPEEGGYYPADAVYSDALWNEILKLW